MLSTKKPSTSGTAACTRAARQRGVTSKSPAPFRAPSTCGCRCRLQPFGVLAGDLGKPSLVWAQLAWQLWAIQSPCLPACRASSLLCSRHCPAIAQTAMGMNETAYNQILALAPSKWVDAFWCCQPMGAHGLRSQLNQLIARPGLAGLAFNHQPRPLPHLLQTPHAPRLAAGCSKGRRTVAPSPSAKPKWRRSSRRPLRPSRHSRTM